MFLNGFIISGVVEYFSSCLLEKLFHAKWWDYSGEFMNLHGRIYLLGLLFFGAVGCLVICVVAPLFNQKLMLLSKKTRMIICVTLGFVFAVDLVFSAITPNMGVGISQMV